LALRAGHNAGAALPDLPLVLAAIGDPAGVQLGSAIFARKPGDGSAREQAASCQRVLGALANFANEYATRRYRSNLINWGIIPFIIDGAPPFENGDYVYIDKVRDLVDGAAREALVITSDGTARGSFTLAAPLLNETERRLLRAGSLINLNNLNRLSLGGKR
ncbi:MAG: hydratase, partial [Treponema sp.]|nr:hydratase [Treponema sp.]